MTISYLVPGAGGLYCVSMAGDWRICIGLGDLPRSSRDPLRKAVITELGSRLGDQVAVGSNATQIFLYAPSIGLADEAAQVAREVLAQHNISVGTVRTEGWSYRDEDWRDADEMPVESTAAEQERARHAGEQERERERSVRTGSPAWQVRVALSSHRDVVALAEDLAAQGWRVRRGIISLTVWANCHDDAVLQAVGFYFRQPAGSRPVASLTRDADPGALAGRNREAALSRSAGRAEECHGFEIDLGDIAVRQPRKPSSLKINMSPDLRPYNTV